MIKSAETVIVAVALAIATAGILYIRHAFVKAGKYDAAIAELAQVRQDHANYVQLHDEQDRKRDAASQGYHDEVTRLQADAARRPVPIVRLCAQPAAHLPAAATPAGGPETTATAAGVVPAGTTADTRQGPRVVDPPDIGPDLAALARRCDDLSAQTRHILQLVGD